MNDITLDYSVLEKEFLLKIETWIKSVYKLSSIDLGQSDINTLESIETELQPKTILLKFIRDTLNQLISKATLTESTIPKLFHLFIKCIFNLKPQNQDLLYDFGQILRAFNHVLQFDISIETIHYLRMKLNNNLCDYSWLDVITLENLYNAISPIEQKNLKFSIRNLILLIIRDKDQRVKEINI